MSRNSERMVKVFLIATVLASCPAAVSAQSAWTLNRGGFFFQNTASYLDSDEFYDASGEKVSLGSETSFRDFTNSLYMEYGIRDRLGLVMSLPVKSLTLDRNDVMPSLVNTGFADFTVGLKYRIYEGSAVVSVQAEALLPTGYNSTVTQPPLGDGESAFTGWLVAGRSLYPLPGYVQGSIGYRSRDGDFSDQILSNAEAGFWPHQRVLVIGRWNYLSSTDDDGSGGAIEDRFGGSLTANFRVNSKVDLQGGVARTFGGINTSAGTQLIVGIAFKGNLLGKYDGVLSSTLSETQPETARPAPPSSQPDEDGSEESDTPSSP